MSDELSPILTQLVGLERILNDSIDHTREINHTYPRAAKTYNQILKYLKELSRTNSNLKIFVNDSDNFEERDFLAHGNFKYAETNHLPLEKSGHLSKYGGYVPVKVFCIGLGTFRDD